MNTTTAPEATVSEPVVGYCRTCKTEKPETAFPTISPLRANGYEGVRDWEECRACKAARREARKSPDYVHPDVLALVDAARSHGFEATVELGSHTVFVIVRHVPDGTEAKTMLDIVNAADVMFLTFRRLSGGLVSGTRCSWGKSRKVRDLRDAFSTVNVWAI